MSKPKFGYMHYVTVARWPKAVGTIAGTRVNNGERFYTVSWHGAPYGTTIEHESELRDATEEESKRYQS